MNRLPASVRAIMLTSIAAIVLFAATVMIAGIWFDFDSEELLRFAGWLALGAVLSLGIAIFLLWVVDRAADGSYRTRLSISGILIALVVLGTALPAIEKSEISSDNHQRLWLILGFAIAIAATFSVLAAWFDSRPLRVTATEIFGIARGNYRARLPEEGNDELTQIAIAANLLTSRAQATANRQATQDHVRDNLLLAITTDTQQPIDRLRTVADSIEREPNIDAAILQRYITIIERETNILQRHLDEIDEIARLERGQVTLRIQSVSLAQLLIAICERLQPVATTRHIVIQPRVDFSLPYVLIDPEQTYQALEALIGYALLETPDNAQLSIEMRGAGELVQAAALVLLSDAGEDIAARVRWESSHRQRASALSLAVAGRLLEAQGGSFLISRGNLDAPLVIVSLPRD